MVLLLANMDSEVQITVDNAITKTPDSGRKYTSYLITIQTSNIAFTLHESKVRRRFSEFVWLKSWLSKYYKETKVPDLPPKKYFGQQFYENVIEERCIGLQKFLQEVVAVTHYLSDSAVHLFLQTHLNVDDIITTVEGRSGKTVLETIMEAGKLLSRLESSLDSGLVSTTSSSDERQPPGQLDLSNSVPSLPHHMIFSPTRPDSPILSFIPGSADTLDARDVNIQDAPISIEESVQTSLPNHLDVDLNDRGNASNISAEEIDSASTRKCGNDVAQRESREEETQKRKVTFCTEVTVAQVVPSQNVQGKFVKA